MRRDLRLRELERQGKILMSPPKLLGQLELTPAGNTYRVFLTDYQQIITEYERSHGRHNVKMHKAFPGSGFLQ